jgi:hypothetical protein
MDRDEDGALGPVEGALSIYMKEMHELQAPQMPEVVSMRTLLFLIHLIRDSSGVGRNSTRHSRELPTF